MSDADPDMPDTALEASILEAVNVLLDGGVVAIPTDTVYGLAASPDHPEAIERLFSIKGRSGSKAIPILVSDEHQLARLFRQPSKEAWALARALWPGGLTIVAAASDAAPIAVTRGGGTVGLRMPDDPIALAVISGCGGSLAVTSANRSGDAEAMSADEVRAKLGDRVDLVLDGGPRRTARPSTVVDTTVSPPVVLREGAIARLHILAVLSGALT